MPREIHIVDSHTGGEPTRLVVSGGPDLGQGPLSERLARFRDHHDRFRSAIVNEPRGNDAIVGALLTDPHEQGCSAGVIFFNNVGYLGMCGHGTIGLVATLAYLKRMEPGVQRLDTPVGPVTVELLEDGQVEIGNVASYRYRKQVEVQVEGYGAVRGDIAWGGNWFYLVDKSPVALTLSNLDALTEFTWKIRQALTANGITGKDGGEIDHIEVFGSSSLGQSKNFVLCPGRAYDRSPCGTGTSAKLACLYEDGKLKEGEVWRQESIVGSYFDGRVEIRGGSIQPFVKGSAFVNAEAR
ncbi:MAG TPA: hydroxyproline-2-epimerase, partial [Solibacterales bacterium]|nr:hydroxyproline-2-epimerase [Bryobacterales bacterium]